MPSHDRSRAPDLLHHVPVGYRLGHDGLLEHPPPPYQIGREIRSKYEGSPQPGEGSRHGYSSSDRTVTGANGIPIERLPDDRNIFTFDPSYVEDPGRATLSLSFKDAFGGLITNLAPTQARLPETRAFVIKRFDCAEDGSRIHIEDLVQVFGVYPERKCERASLRNIARVLWIETGETGIIEFIRRVVFNALIGNADMHLKNWSLVHHGMDRLRSAVIR